MESTEQNAASSKGRNALLWLWALGAGLAGAGAGLLVLLFEQPTLNDSPATPLEIFVFMQAALFLGVAAGLLSPAAWVGKRGSAALAGLVGSVVLFVIVAVRVVSAGNGSVLFFGCFTLPFLLVSVLGGIIGSWIGALLADVRRGDG